MRSLFTAFSLLFCFSPLYTQITFQQFPQSLQLYPRNLATNSAEVRISGMAAASPDSLIFTLEKSNGGVERLALSLEGLPDPYFEINFTIQAGLWSYDVKTEQKNADTTILLRQALNVVAGDVLVVEGQSNAQAVSYNGDANIWQNTFIRSFGDPNPANYGDTNWYFAEGNGYFTPGAIGQWALRSGFLIQQNLQVPVAIINGADPGKPIEFFQRNDTLPLDSSTNYGRLLRRLDHAGVTNQVRAMIYYQGESDGDRADIHKNLFEALHADWEENIPNIEAYYVVQVREGCGAPSLQLRQYQKDFENYLKNAKSLTANGINGHDGCHYSLLGYNTLGEKLFKQISTDLYHTPTGEQTNIRVLNARFTNDLNTQITVETDAEGGLVLQPGCAYDFKIQGASASVTGIQADGKNLILELDQSITNPNAGLSYAGHSGSDAWVLNGFGYGMFTFYNLLIDNYHVIPNFSIPGIMSGSGNCISLDGTNDFVYAGPVLTPSYTKEAWINWRGGSQLNNLLSGASGTAFWAPNGLLAAGHNGAWLQVYDAEALVPNQWTHVAVTYDALQEELRLYKNGKLVGQAPDIPAHNDPEVYIGSFAGCCNFGGRMDEVRIWDTVRTIEEIRADMCQKLKGTEQGLSTYFRFDETAGSIAPNETTGPDGQLYNFDGLGLNEAWQRSGAPIGTKSTYSYQNTVQLDLTAASGDSLVLSMPGVSDFVHLYITEEVPNVLQPADGFTVVDNTRYFGIFYPKQSIGTYQLTYHYTGNPFAFVQEANNGLLQRRSNEQFYWESASEVATNSTEHAITVTNTLYQEYILALLDSVAALPLSAALVLVQAIPCNGLSNGVIQVQATGGLAPYSYSLNGGLPQASGLFTNLAPGAYSVLVEDHAGNNFTTNLLELQSPPPLTINVQVLGNDGILSWGGGTPPYYFQTDAPDPTLEGLPNGAYSVSITDANGCTASTSFEVDYHPLALTPSTFDLDPCDGISDIVVIAQGGSTPYLYSLNNGPFQPGNTFQDLPSGTYTFQVMDAAGQMIESDVIEQILPPELQVSSLTSLDSILVLVSGGNAPYSYSLNGGAPQTDSLFYNLDQGLYSIEVIDASGCQKVIEGILLTSETAGPGASWGISVIPNPGTGLFRIQIGDLENPLRATVWDLNGSQIQSLDIEPGNTATESSVDLSGQADGLYWLRITDGRKIENLRLVKIK